MLTRLREDLADRPGLHEEALEGRLGGARVVGVVGGERDDRGRLLAYWDGAIKRRAEKGARSWKRLLELRKVLEEA